MFSSFCRYSPVKLWFDTKKNHIKLKPLPDVVNGKTRLLSKIHILGGPGNCFVAVCALALRKPNSTILRSHMVIYSRIILNYNCNLGTYCVSNRIDGKYTHHTSTCTDCLNTNKYLIKYERFPGRTVLSLIKRELICTYKSLGNPRRCNQINASRVKTCSVGKPSVSYVKKML